MKYFTPQRLANLLPQDTQDGVIRALEDWEQAVSDYGEQFQRVKQHLPREMRHIVQSISLHDARVFSMGHDPEKFRLKVTLHPESDPEHLIYLDYKLADIPRTHDNVLPEHLRHEPLVWMYDELDVAEPQGFIGLPASPGKKPTLRHNILLSNGWEIELRFTTVTAKRMERILPLPEPPISMDAESKREVTPARAS